MDIRKVQDVDSITRAVDAINAKYDGNVQIDRLQQIDTKGHAFRVKLRVRDSKGPGAHHSAPSPWNEGRRTVALCWHTFRDFFQALYVLEPNARVKTALARYDGVDGFEANYPRTYWTNTGSVAFPSAYGDLCLCSEAMPLVKA
jgi:hypothetical protein